MATANCQTFATYYMELCRQQKLRPLPVICVTLPHSLDFTTDRVKMDDWKPILNALSLDQSLKSVCVRSRFQCRKPLEEVNSADKARAIGKAPVVLTRYLLEWLSHSIAQCVRNSSALTCLELEGVPLPDDCLAALCVGLASTETLQHLSLQRCYIGDNSCGLVCRTVADVQSIRSLNLSQCDLSSDCGPALASALSKQKLLLYHDTWKDSLRYREPNLDAMPGLRRLTLNGNPHLGDSAIGEVIDAIEDSLWLKALDIQDCGLTDAIGHDILQLLERNTTLEVVDLRCNLNLSEDIVQEIFKRLQMNKTGCRLEYRFLKTPQRDNRALSASTKRREKSEEFATFVGRPRSAVTRNSKRPCQSGALRKAPPVVSAAKRTKTKPPVPHFTIEKTQNKVWPADVKSAKPFLHLDLQTQIKTTLTEAETPENERETSEQSEEKKTPELEQLLKHLSEAKESEEKLINEMRQIEVQLGEERARREMAEMKLRVMKRELEDLESALKAKEIETRGYLLISQKSLDEISKSFEQLLEIIEDYPANPSARWHSTEAQARENIKQKVSLLLRKTKSEKLDQRKLELKSPTKLAKSSSDIRTSVPLILSQLEKTVGDTADAIPSANHRRQNKLPKPAFSPCERARALFAQIINGDVILNLDSPIS